MIEIIAHYQGDTWRAIYAVRFSEAIYVLHAFQKKSKRGMATPKKDIDLIHSAWLRPNVSTEKGRTNMATRTKKLVRSEKSTGNVFADLALPHPEQELLRARLTLQIYRLIKERGLTQGRSWEDPRHQATQRLRIDAQPLRCLLRGAPHGLSCCPWAGRGD